MAARARGDDFVAAIARGKCSRAWCDGPRRPPAGRVGGRGGSPSPPHAGHGIGQAMEPVTDVPDLVT
jgi:hypothetical protein